MDVTGHYDRLIDEDNDPVFDVPPLREYMDKWDGKEFIDRLRLDSTKSVLEIGVGTGRLALRTAPLCGRLCGIDISPKTAERARKNLESYTNVGIICGDFMTYGFSECFDVIYSSLTFMHIRDKQTCINKVASLLKKGGIFALSIDKNGANYIDAGGGRLLVYPDNPTVTEAYIAASAMEITEKYQTEFAHVFICTKK